MNHYNAFIKIIETGSFTKAAEALDYTQSGISQLMKNLEMEVRTKLIIRSRHGITLTDDGKQLFAHINNIVQAKRLLDEKIAHMEGLERATIRLGVFASVSNHYIPNWIKNFKQTYPHVHFELTLGNYTEIEQMIKNGLVDIGFTNPEVTKDLPMTPIATDEYMVCLPLDHRLANEPFIDIHELKHEIYILIKDGSINPIEEYLKQNEVQLQVDYVVSEDRLALEMIKKGLGVSVMPSMIIPETEQEIAIKSLSLPKKREIHLAYKDFDILPIAVRKFIEFIKK